MTLERKKMAPPRIEQWLQEAKSESAALEQGIFLLHNGVVRQTPRQKVHHGIDDGFLVRKMDFSHNKKKVEAAIAETRKMKGIFHVRVWLNEGCLEPGEDIMYILIGGDIRPHVFTALESLIEKIKGECVTEIERF